jgi:hypothetical protein
VLGNACGCVAALIYGECESEKRAQHCDSLVIKYTF